MAYRDLREYIARLEDEGEVQRIEREVDWNLEIGAIIRRSYDLRAPAPFFQKIKGYPPGYTIFGAPMGTSSKPHRYHARLALSMGMRPDSSAEDIIEEYIKRRKAPIKPVIVSDGPCKENVHLGEDVDLYEFPTPLIHHGDGGRYIGTWHTVVTKDPDTGWVNWGMYRLMLHDSKTMGMLLNPFQHIGLHYHHKYETRNRPMEFAVAIGTEPITSLVSCTWLAPGANEADVAGGVRQEPVQLVKCQTVDLEVPATAEIVLDGEIPPYERREEGPFGEYTGYRAGDRAPRPVCHVKAVTHRNSPILSVSCMGVPVDDSAAAMNITKAAEILDNLRTMGFPVRMVYCPPEAVGFLVVVSTKVPFSGYTRQLANAIWGSNAGRFAYYLAIVEDDVDVTNLGEVIWALCTRCHPDRGIFKMPNTRGTQLLPFLNSDEKRQSLGACALFDCTWPTDWPKEAIPVKASFDVMWPKEIQEKVLENWGEYGYRH